MVYPIGRRKYDVVVAVLTNVAGLDVRWIFANRVGAVMAADTIGHDVCVFKESRNPASGRMTIVTVVAAADVRGVLAGRNRAVVTRRASTDDLGMINGVGRREEVAVMAILAHVAGLDMPGIFANCDSAVMT